MSDLFTPRGIWSALSGADRAVSVLVLALSGLLALALRAPGAPPHANVFVDGKGVATLPLDRDADVVVAGRLGPVRIRVADGAVRVAESTCRQGICRAMGAKRRSGDVIVCVPNALTVRLAGEPGAGAPDAIAR